ncbi:MAG: hypothetical protein ABJA37_14650, partial [Ferruginibacter sp.]
HISLKKNKTSNRNNFIIFCFLLQQSRNFFIMNYKALEIPVLKFDIKGELIITASASSSFNDFNFFTGKWKLHNKKLS